MKNFILVFLILLSANLTFGVDYSRIDNQSKTVPTNLKTVEEIAHYLTRNLTSPTDKARAIYIWIAHNIQYDLVKMDANATYFNAQELVDEVLKSRKGVCANYAQLFQSCCQSAGIQSYVINGYTSTDGKVAKQSHAWNAIKVNNQYFNIDVTWAAGYIQTGRYVHEFRDQFFLIKPSEFIKTHIPFDPIWQFSNNPVTHKEFEKADFSKQKSASNYNFTDSITVLYKLSELDKMIRENRRIFHNGLVNQLIISQFEYNQKSIENLKYNKLIEKFQASQDLFNKGVENYNFYVLSKNKQFESTTLDDSKIIEMLSSSRQYVDSAEFNLNSIYTDKSELNRLIDEMKTSIHLLKTNLTSEDVFVKKYIKTWKPLRMLLFVTIK